MFMSSNVGYSWDTKAHPCDVLGIGQIAYDTQYRFDSDKEVEHALSLISPQCDFQDVKYNTIFQKASGSVLSTIYPVYAAQVGGAVANTVVLMSMLGMRSSFITDYGYDAYAVACIDDLCAHDIAVLNAAKDTARTCECIILVHPDNNHTIVSVSGTKSIKRRDVDFELAKMHKMLLVEGFVLTTAAIDEVLGDLLSETRKAGVMNVLTLSDPLLLKEQRYEYEKLLPLSDCLVGNVSQMRALYGQTYDLYHIAQMALRNVNAIIITLGKDGVFIAFRNSSSDEDDFTVVRYDAPSVTGIVSTLGAGDAFMGGLLSGLLKGIGLDRSVIIGNKCAAHILQHVGTHPSREFTENLKAEIDVT